MSNEINKLYEFGGFRLNPQKKELWKENEFVSLSPKSFSLLKLLVERHGEIVSKQEIFDTVWSDTFVEEGVLTQNIYTLRQILGTHENGKQIIENVPRRGYRLNIPVEIKEENKNKIKVDLTDSLNQSRNAEQVFPLKSQKRSTNLLFLVSVFAFLLFGFVGFHYLSSKTPEIIEGTIEKLQFEQLTDTGDASYLTVAADGGAVAYTRSSGVYLKNLNDKTETKVSIGNVSAVGCLQFSLDGNSLFFGTLTSRDEKGNIFKVGKNGGAPVLIAEDVWSGFSVSPDGKFLAFVRKTPAQNKQELIIKTLETGVEKSIKSLKLPEEFYWNNYPAWSADAAKIALVVITQTEHFQRLIIIDLNGGEQELKPPNFRNVEQIVWAAGGGSLIASANDGKNFQLWKISISDGAARRITNDLNSYLGISISNDRQKLVSRQRIYFSNIWTARREDLSDLKQLTTGTSRNDGLRGLAWIDEEKIVYSTNDERIRDWNLWILSTADGARQKLTGDVETQNDYPVVAPDKKTIYFASDRNKSSRIWRINADGTNAVQVTFGEEETHHFPQISPDGNWLYFIIKSGRSSTIGRKSLNENSMQELSGKTAYAVGNFLTISPDGKTLAFQNINYENKNDRRKLQIGLLSTADPQSVEFREIDAWQQRIEWTANSDSFEYVAGNVKQSSIFRQSLSPNSPSEKVLQLNDSMIFNFAWSPEGKNLAIARGQLLRDVVLLTNFE